MTRLKKMQWQLNGCAIKAKGYDYGYETKNLYRIEDYHGLVISKEWKRVPSLQNIDSLRSKEVQIKANIGKHEVKRKTSRRKVKELAKDRNVWKSFIKTRLTHTYIKNRP